MPKPQTNATRASWIKQLRLISDCPDLASNGTYQTGTRHRLVFEAIGSRGLAAMLPVSAGPPVLHHWRLLRGGIADVQAAIPLSFQEHWYNIPPAEQHLVELPLRFKLASVIVRIDQRPVRLLTAANCDLDANPELSRAARTALYHRPDHWQADYWNSIAALHRFVEILPDWRGCWAALQRAVRWSAVRRQCWSVYSVLARTCQRLILPVASFLLLRHDLCQHFAAPALEYHLVGSDGSTAARGRLSLRYWQPCWNAAVLEHLTMQFAQHGPEQWFVLMPTLTRYRREFQQWLCQRHNLLPPAEQFTVRLRLLSKT